MEVLWRTKPALVEEEISRMRQEDGRTGPDFQLRTAASKNIIQNMTQQELNSLEDAGLNMQRNGYSEDHKRRSVNN